MTVSARVPIIGIVLAISALLIWLRWLWFKRVEPVLNAWLNTHLDKPLLRLLPFTAAGIAFAHYYVVVFAVWLVMIVGLYSQGTLDDDGFAAAIGVVALGIAVAMLWRRRRLSAKGIRILKKRRLA